MINNAIKKVIVVFKTHLDIGFTDYSENIVKCYIEKFIPNAIKVGKELKDTNTPFIWTVGSWMINEALKRENKELENAISEGIICWHGLPFTTHTELMSPKLFEYGLSISRKLDERFQKKTISSKMTDVPGHTIGIVPYMEKAGIKFLHLGVNPATPIPDVPKIFKWKCNDSSIVVMYEGDYGEAEIFGDTALEFAHSHDNEGPQSADEIKGIYRELSKKYPNARIEAGTLDDFAKIVLENSENIPVVDKEIGDTWIHGAATDPKKVSQYRSLLRYIDEYGINEKDLTDNLLLVPEHTWGMDCKTFFHDDVNFTYEELEKIPESRKVIEKSWQEQRDYVKKAEEVLNTKALYDTTYPDLNEFSKINADECGLEISWQLFDRSDMEHWSKTYMRLHVDWSIWDQLRVGLPEYEGGIFSAKVTEAYKKDDKYVYILRFDESISEKYGLPYFTVEKEKEKVQLKWYGKKISKLPQAFWLKFKGFSENWSLNKMGQWIKAEDIIDSSLITGVYEGVKNGEYIIKSLDAPLVAPFGRNIFKYNINDKKQNLYFNLYNNQWSTNFPLWYEDDAVFRFIIEKLK